MAVSFVHTGDWHIGKPFGRFEVGKAEILRRARLEAIDRLAAAARAAGTALVLVAGDIYDGPGLGEREMREPLARMRNYPDLVWHLIPGNHDPAAVGGIWDRVLRDSVPDNVIVHMAPAPAALADGCWLLPAPLAAKVVTRDPTAYMAESATPDGAVRIGLAHGSIQGFGSEREASVNIAPDRARSAGLAYLALGDWHGVRRIGPATWYAGTPEPDGFLDNEPGHALVVRIATAGAPAHVERVVIGQYSWLKRVIDATRPTDLAGLEAEIDRFGPEARHVLLEVVATGRISLAEDRDFATRLGRIEPAVLHLTRRLEALRLAPAAADLDKLASGALRDLAAELAGLAAGGGGDEAGTSAPVAERALRRLFELAQAAEASA